MKNRRTRQLEAVLTGLRSMGHPTAAELHSRVRGQLPRVSVGTVYRNLEKLVAAGEAVAVYLEGEPARYDGRVVPHGHFVCERCRRITDLIDGIEPAVNTARLRRAGYAVRFHSLGVFGLCHRCGENSASVLTAELGSRPGRGG